MTGRTIAGAIGFVLLVSSLWAMVQAGLPLTVAIPVHLGIAAGSVLVAYSAEPRP